MRADEHSVTGIRRTLLASCVALAITAPLGGVITHAAPGDATATTSDTTISVVEGDSLVGLAHRYGVSVSALLRANSMTLASVIHPGNTMVIPAGATLPAPRASSATSGSSTSSGSATSGATAGTYIVQPGDALAGIAWRHGVKLGALVKANGLEVTSLILPGRSLAIPPATLPIPTARTAATPSAASAASATTAVAPSQSPAQSGTSIDTVLTYARAQVGVPYRFFSAGPDAFDCSGLVVAAFGEVGMSLPHQSRALAQRGTAVDWTTAAIEPGDLVFTSTVDDPAMITHVGIALGSQTWVQAIGGSRPVSITRLPSDTKIMAVRRIALP